jgi:hypothetical protein
MIDPTVATVSTECDRPAALPTPNRHRLDSTRFSPMLYVDVLGPVRAEVDSGDQRIDVTPKTGREQMALAALALAAPGALTVAGLAEVLYGDDEISDPRNAVQAVISGSARRSGRHRRTSRPPQPAIASLIPRSMSQPWRRNEARATRPAHWPFGAV